MAISIKIYRIDWMYNLILSTLNTDIQEHESTLYTSNKHVSSFIRIMSLKLCSVF